VLHITPWERRALQLLAQGRATTEIANCLGTGESEVGVCLTALFSKMGASSETEAIESASRRGLLIRENEPVGGDKGISSRGS